MEEIDFNIRPATDDDVLEIVALVNSAYRGESSKQGWATEADLVEGTRIDKESLTRLMCSPDSIVLTCSSGDEKIIGCVHLETRSNQLYLGMLTVSPTLQGAGIGKLLLKTAEQFARTQNLDSIVMTVISAREKLISWYERHGYVKTGDREPFPESDPAFGRARKPLEFLVLRKQVIG